MRLNLRKTFFKLLTHGRGTRTRKSPMRNICDWSGFYELLPVSQFFSMIINEWEMIKCMCQYEHSYMKASLDCVFFLLFFFRFVG